LLPFDRNGNGADRSKCRGRRKEERNPMNTAGHARKEERKEGRKEKQAGRQEERKTYCSHSCSLFFASNFAMDGGSSSFEKQCLMVVGKNKNMCYN
jgi:hypothetical protein